MATDDRRVLLAQRPQTTAHVAIEVGELHRLVDLRAGVTLVLRRARLALTLVCRTLRAVAVALALAASGLGAVTVGTALT
ncbi:hypothetical protein [Oerskovia sp. USHLN155]|uniref:hypothetical protein n=1 Tax=Oerskovia sp. USHLN155 TaxID=3081288 RepID=UPI00301ACC6C